MTTSKIRVVVRQYFELKETLKSVIRIRTLEKYR